MRQTTSQVQLDELLGAIRGALDKRKKAKVFKQAMGTAKKSIQTGITAQAASHAKRTAAFKASQAVKVSRASTVATAASQGAKATVSSKKLKKMQWQVPDYAKKKSGFEAVKDFAGKNKKAIGIAAAAGTAIAGIGYAAHKIKQRRINSQQSGSRNSNLEAHRRKITT